MSYFLIVYDRSSGKQIALEPFKSREEATRARFEREAEERNHPRVEVVVLGASSLESLQRTHGRYFKTLGQLSTAG